MLRTVDPPYNALFARNVLYLNFEKKHAFLQFFKKKNVVTPQKITDLDKIFTRGTSHYGLPP